MDVEIDTFVEQRRDTIPGKLISNVELEFLKEDRINKGKFPLHNDIVLGEKGFEIVYIMHKLPTQARQVANINATWTIKHELDIIKQLKCSEF